MPPISPQGSRGGLITAVVVFTVLFVTSTIFAIYFNAELRHREQDLVDQKNKSDEVVTEAYRNNSDFAGLRAQAERGGAGGASRYRGMPLLEVAVSQRNDLAKLITGAATYSGVDSQVNDAMQAATAKEVIGSDLKLTPTDSLVAAVRALASKVAALQASNDKLVADNNAAKDQVKQTLDAQQKLLAEKDQQIADINAKADAAIKQVTDYQQKNDQMVVQIRDDSTKALNKTEAGAQELQKSVAERDTQLKKMNSENEKLRQKLQAIRPDTKETIVQQADGRITRLAGGGVVYINLGAGDQISPGFTFEVYDKRKGIPAMGEGLRESGMPVGKASIEVTRVGEGASECRIVKQEIGQPIVEGDLIANLVYDPKTKYNFLVYGAFDLDQNGVSTPADAEIIKRLIGQWGARVTDTVNTDTDFVVMGKEPEVPTLSKEEEGDPVAQKRVDDAKKAADAYQDVRQKAVQLNIPIMNQNRFLYFVGYYELAKR